MKKLLPTALAALLLSLPANAADTYQFDPNHTNINWSANHFGFSNPSGKFNDVSGKLILDEKNPQNSSVDVVIKIASLNTGLSKFDKHLKSADFFNFDKYETAKFTSTSVKVLGKNKAKITGDFTLLGVTKPLTLDVKLNKIGLNQFTQVKTAGFSASGVIKRSEFDMNYGVPGVSDEVKLEIEAEANFVSSDEIVTTTVKPITKNAKPEEAKKKL